MKNLIFIAPMLFLASVTVAEPVTFKCTTAEGDPAADLVIDTSKKSLVWAKHQKYKIHSMSDRYISAYLQNSKEVGGEVWVFNRVSGEYLRASAFIGWESSEAIKRKEPGKLTATTFRGKCTRPLL